MPSFSFDDHDAPLYTVGQVADMLGVQPAFLRRLDTEHVVRPVRSPGGQRRYSRVEIERVERVAELTGEGVTLAGVRRLLDLEAELAELRGELAAERAKRPNRAPKN
jgi:DNA-binding transcriptional MerR regulator